MTQLVSSAELERLAAEASAASQAIQDALGRTDNDSGRLRFPRGYLVTAGTWRQQVRFVRRNSILNNVAYTLMLHDVYSWLLRRTDIAGLARGMIIKAALAALGSVAEAILVDHYDGQMGRRQKFVSRTARMVSDGIISNDQKADLDWLWDMRCRQHLHDVAGAEFDFYQVADHRRAARAVRTLIQSLQNAA